MDVVCQPNHPITPTYPQTTHDTHKSSSTKKKKFKNSKKKKRNIKKRNYILYKHNEKTYLVVDLLPIWNVGIWHTKSKSFVRSHVFAISTTSVYSGDWTCDMARQKMDYIIFLYIENI
jgi:hypothetical protein